MQKNVLMKIMYRASMAAAAAILIAGCISFTSGTVFAAEEDDPFAYREGAALEALEEETEKYPDFFDLRNVDTDGDGKADKSFVTPVKVQNPFGACWGFAAIAAAESSILGDSELNGGEFSTALDQHYTKENMGSDGKPIIDLSEKQTAYFATSHLDDPSSSQNGEGMYFRNLSDKDLKTSAYRYDTGGTTLFATSLFAAGIGPVLESAKDRETRESMYDMLAYRGAKGDPVVRRVAIKYNEDGTPEKYARRHVWYSEDDDWSMPEKCRYISSFKIKDSLILPSSVDSRDTMVEAVKQQMYRYHRAVSIGFCAESYLPGQDTSGKKYMSEHWAHYVNVPEFSNHAVTIVGWDDNYPKENFLTEPAGDGAFLIKNSWGSEQNEEPLNAYRHWGLLEGQDGVPYDSSAKATSDRATGYFWISYYDRSLSDPEAFVFEREEGTDYDIAQMDLAHTSHIGLFEEEGCMTANVFTAEKTSELTDISVMTTVPGTDVEYKVYALPDDFDDPESGIMIAEGKEAFDSGGYHRIELNTSMVIAKDQKYSVVIKESAEDVDGGNYAVYRYFYNSPYSDMSEPFYNKVVVNKRESYFCCGGKWSDISDKAVQESITFSEYDEVDNFPIKAYLKPVFSGYLTVSNWQEGTPGTFRVLTDNSKTLTAEFRGAIRDMPDDWDPEITWKSSDESVFKVTNKGGDYGDAVVEGLSEGRVLLTVSAGEYGTRVISVTVSKPQIEWISFKDYIDEFTYTGEAIEPEIETVWAESGDDEEVPELIEGVDYTIEYKDNIKPGTASVTVSGIGKYGGSVTEPFTILKPDKAKRTIMLYDCGTDLETGGKMASYNLRQILRANFSKDDDIRFIVMTGGANKWHLEKEYLEFPDDVNVPADAVEEQDPDDEDKWIVSDDNKSRISNVYNQIWEARGADDTDCRVEPEDENKAAHGKMVLLDGDGVLGDGENAKRSKIDTEHDYIIDEDGFPSFDVDKIDKYEWMNDPEVLKAFIDYCVEHAPAEKYDLILWDHGLGPKSGFCSDEQEYMFGYDSMCMDEIIDAFSDNKVADADDDGVQDGKFDLIDFDACLMGSAEVAVSIADYMDYLVVSPMTEPGYGQNYEYWLNELGEGKFDGEDGTYELGKKIVDDFIDFYDKEEGDGSSQEGTLAVIDMNKLMTGEVNECTFVEALDLLTRNLEDGLREGKYYDEFRSFRASIEYDGMEYYDLGILASQLAYAFDDADLENLTPEGKIDDTNRYTEIAEIIMGFLSDPEIIYAKGTKGVHTKEQYYRAPDGEMKYGEQGNSGMHIAFCPKELPFDGFQTCHGEYNKVIEKIEKAHPDRAAFLEDHLKTMETYGLAFLAGKAVSEMVSDGMPKSSVDFDAVIKYWDEHGDEDDFGNNIPRMFVEACGGEQLIKGWLGPMIEHMRDEVILKDQVDVQSEKTETGTGYKVRFNDIWKQAIDTVQYNLVAELPAAEKFMNTKEYKDYLGFLYQSSLDLTIGSVSGSEVYDVDPEKDGYEAVVGWMHTKGSTWKLDPIEEKWYALNDGSGKLSIAGAEIYDKDIEVPTGYYTKELREEYDYETDSYVTKLNTVCHIAYLIFKRDENGRPELSEIAISQDQGGYRFFPISEFAGDLEVQPLLEVKETFFRCYIPISDTKLRLNNDSLQKLELEYVDIKDIPDIKDTDGDKTALHMTVTASNIYGCQLDITDKFKEANPLKVKGKTASVKYKKLKKKSQKLAVSKVIRTVKKGQGSMSYKLVSAKKGGKSFKKYFKINSKTGKVTVKKKLGKGTYKLTIRVRAAGNNSYRASGWKKVTSTIKVR